MSVEIVQNSSQRFRPITPMPFKHTSERFRTVPNGSERFRTVPNGSEQFRTIKTPNYLELFGTNPFLGVNIVQNGSERFRTIHHVKIVQNGSERFQTISANNPF